MSKWRDKYRDVPVDLNIPFPPLEDTTPPGSGECFTCEKMFKHDWARRQAGPHHCPAPVMTLEGRQQKTQSTAGYSVQALSLKIREKRMGCLHKGATDDP